VNKIVNNSKDDPAFFQDDTKLQALFTNIVYDAWGNINKLQSEMQANRMTMELINVLSALKSDDMGLDEFTTQVSNHRVALNKMIEDYKELSNEQNLLNALADLQQINDPDAINVATRETRSQINNIMITERYTDALKNLYDAFNLYIEDRDSAIPQLKTYVQEYSHIVVHLDAVDVDPFPLRTALIAAVRMSEGIEIMPIYEVQCIMDEVIAPQVMGHLSAPKSEELKELMATIQGICDEQNGAQTAKDHVASRLKATNGQKEVKEAMDAHRRRLAYRQRNTVKANSDEVIELRAAEKTGAEWDGFQVEKVELKAKAQVQKSPVEAAFDAFDIDGDSTITIDEVIQYLLSVPPDVRPKGLKDINPFQKGKMRKRLQKMDADNDGTLSFGEFEDWWKQNDK